MTTRDDGVAGCRCFPHLQRTKRGQSRGFQYSDYMEQTETTGDADEVWLVWPELRSAVTFEVMILTAADFTLRFAQFVLRREMCAR